MDEVTVHCDILGRLSQAYSGETMAHEARVRAHLSRMEHSPYHLPRRVRQRTDDGPGDMTTTFVPQREATGSRDGGAASSLFVEPTSTTHVDGETAPDSEVPSTAYTGESPTTFSILSPDSIFMDTLSSAEGGSQDKHLPTDQGGDRPAEDGDGHTTDLMQRTKKCKRGSREPAPRPADLTASFSWRTLRPPRGTPRARGRGRSTGRRPVIPKTKPRPAEMCQESEEETDEEEEIATEDAHEGTEETVVEGGGPTTTLPDDAEIRRREEHYQTLRRELGVGEANDGVEAPWASLRTHWTESKFCGIR